MFRQFTQLQRWTRRSTTHLLRSAIVVVVAMSATITSFGFEVSAGATSVQILAGSHPVGIAVNARTNTLYVASQFDNSVVVIDGWTTSNTTTIALDHSPTAIAVNEVTNMIYVTNGVNNSLSVIDGASNTLVTTFEMGWYPTAVSVNVATNTIYVVNTYGNTLSVVDGATNTRIADIPVGFRPQGVAVNPFTHTVYVANNGYGTLSVIDGSTNAVTATVDVAPWVSGVTVNPYTAMVYVTSQFNNTVSVINGVTNDIINTIAVGGGANHLEVNPATQTIYVTNSNDNSLSVIDELTGMVTLTVVTGAYPTALAVNASANAIYVVNTDNNTVSVLNGTALAAAPDTPTDVVGTTLQNGASTVSWVPGDNGGSLASFLVTASPGGAQCATADSSCIVTGLTNGLSYTFSVVAMNAIGWSEASANSAPITPATVPSAPSRVMSLQGNGSAEVSWSDGANNGSGIVSQTVYAFSGATQISATTCFGSPCSIVDLAVGSNYTFQVTATNGVGEGARSLASTPALVPSAPTNVVAVRGDSTAEVSWSAGAINGSPLTHSVVYTYVGRTQVSKTICSASPCTINGLINGMMYSFNVTAINSIGESALSHSSNLVTPGATPNAPSNVTLIADSPGRAHVNWVNGASNGSQIAFSTVYLYANSIDNLVAQQQCWAWASCTIDGLLAGVTYAVKVTSTNEFGEGIKSQLSNTFTPVTTPSPPINVSAIPGFAQATVSWEPPAASGGSPITSYRVTASPGAATCTVVVAVPEIDHCTIGNLSIGLSYSFSVVATNAAGSSAAASGASATPGFPAPTLTSLTTGSHKVTIGWQAPIGGASSYVGKVVSPSGQVAGTCKPKKATARSCTISGLPDFVRYSAVVVAIHQGGLTSLPSNLAYGTPVSSPAKPKIASLVITAHGNVAIVIHPSLIDAAMPVTYHFVIRDNNGATVQNFASTGFVDIVSGLTSKRKYSVVITATTQATESGLAAPAVSATKFFTTK